MNNLRTGDILLFHGTKSCLDKFLECIIPSRYSHTAMVIVIPNPGFPDTELAPGIYVIESTRSGQPDAEDHLMKLGVQMTRIEDILAEKDQVIYYRKLRRCFKGDDFYRRLRRAHDVIHNKPYDFDVTDWLNAASYSWWHRLCCKKQTVKRFWCSAVVSYLLVELKLLPNNTPWTEVSPRDLGTEPGGNKVKFINCIFSPEVRIN